MPVPTLSDIHVTVLVDNAPHAPGLEREHGLSLWIETPDARILFDTGRSDAALRNARRLGVEIDTADVVFLSHGHYDHADGLPAFDTVLPDDVPVVVHPGAIVKRYSLRGDTCREIGVGDGARRVLEKRRRIHADGRVEIAPNIVCPGPAPRRTPFEDTGGPFFLDPEGTRPDPLDDDLALQVETDSGAYVFVGCAHAGVVNMLEHAAASSPSGRVAAVTGGMHLRDAGAGRLRRTREWFASHPVEIFRPLHCSGPAAESIVPA